MRDLLQLLSQAPQGRNAICNWHKMIIAKFETTHSACQIDDPVGSAFKRLKSPPCQVVGVTRVARYGLKIGEPLSALDIPLGNLPRFGPDKQFAAIGRETDFYSLRTDVKLSEKIGVRFFSEIP